MRLGIMQPYFFPYIGYFDLMNRVDHWVVFDVAQYTPKSWMNRNRILRPTDGWQYITVPVSHPGRCAIKEVTTVDKGAACERILGQIEHYRKGRAPFFSGVRELIEQCFSGAVTDTLVELNVRSLALTANYLRIPFEHTVLSQSGIQFPAITHPGQWALEISAAFRADEYINPAAGRELFRSEDFGARGIRLSFAELLDYRYASGPYTFVERLSIIDAMMWNAPDAIKGYLDDVAARPEETRRGFVHSRPVTE
jgi:hypothetical protein